MGCVSLDGVSDHLFHTSHDSLSLSHPTCPRGMSRPVISHQGTPPPTPVFPSLNLPLSFWKWFLFSARPACPLEQGTQGQVSDGLFLCFWGGN